MCSCAVCAVRCTQAKVLSLLGLYFMSMWVCYSVIRHYTNIQMSWRASWRQRQQRWWKWWWWWYEQICHEFAAYADIIHNSIFACAERAHTLRGVTSPYKAKEERNIEWAPFIRFIHPNALFYSINLWLLLLSRIDNIILINLRRWEYN